ncbi:hypothetical protein IKD56_01100 [bacterium]|nr:hypothetical protein [bacterium]
MANEALVAKLVFKLGSVGALTIMMDAAANANNKNVIKTILIHVRL